jgi:hypothetical protein
VDCTTSIHSRLLNPIDCPGTSLIEKLRTTAGLTALTTRLLGVGGMMNGPVCIGGAAVSPGDLVIVDETGIAILPRAEAEADLGIALEMQAVGPGLIAQSGPSMPLGVLSGATSLVMSKLKAQTHRVAGQTNPL